ncbi:hypothetical protein DFS34DRAFT_618913 [Phlyctochytrium arcticum]|nr:hypothetical protein DFS34DRAFT_618913 [Phlyctochytrium arcticum]
MRPSALLFLLASLFVTSSLAQAALPTSLQQTGYWIPEAAFKGYADQVTAAYNQIPNPTPELTKAVEDLVSVAGHGPVDTNAVRYLTQQLVLTIPGNDPSYNTLRSYNDQLAQSAQAADSGNPIPVPAPVPGGNPTFVPANPTSTPSPIVTVIQTLFPGATTSTLVTVTYTPTGAAGPGTYNPPFQPSQVVSSGAAQTLLLAGTTALGLTLAVLAFA